MAQKTGKEEMELKKIVPESISLCVKCAVSGVSVSVANNLCQKCFNATAAASGAEKSLRTGSNPRSSPERKAISAETRPDLKKDFDLTTPVKREVNRCSGCRRKVGLTGFRCRCGDLFCADHRYSDRHSCSYDYKSAGRDAIARENPVVKAAKIVRI